MAHGKPAVVAPLPVHKGPADNLERTVILYWAGQDIRTLPRKKLLEIIRELGGEVKTLREENTRLNIGKFRR